MKLNSQDAVLLHLSLIPGIGAVTIASLVHNKPNSFDWSSAYALSIEQWQTLFGIGYVAAQKIVAGLVDRDVFDQELALLQKYEISCITRENEQYPALLKQIYCAPPVLYCKGNSSLLHYERTIAIVGSRDANTYAKKVITQFVHDLVGQQWVIVSGGAFGADGMAHQETIEQGGKTVVVLGSGLLRPYPTEHVPLFKKIVAHNGLLVSIFPLTASAHKGNFPARNRVIAGLSKGCIVVQAAQKSGARITAEFALQQGREVFAVPGNIFEPLSAGCHALLSEGAHVATSVEQILAECGYKSEQSALVSEKKIVPAKSHGSKMMLQEVSHVSAIQKIILQHCSKQISLDELAAQTNISMTELQSELFSLKLEGRITQDFTGMWVSL